MTTATAPKYILTLDTKSPFDIQAVCQEDSTIKKYQHYFKTWKDWSTTHQVCFLTPSQTKL